MLVLAIDTSQRSGHVGLLDASGLRSSIEVDGGTFSAQLIPKIKELLQQEKLTLQEVQGIAAAVGPGSFTGLRIGLGAVKGLAEILDIPIAAVSNLAVVARAAKFVEGDVIALLDAGREEVYCGVFGAANSAVSAKSESLLTVSELQTLLAKHPVATVVTPEEKLSERLQNAGIKAKVVAAGIAVIGEIGREMLLAGQTTPVEALDANYLRRDEGLFAPSQASK